MTRLVGTALTLFFPCTALLVSLSMWPLVLNSTASRLALIGALLLSPAPAVYAALRLAPWRFNVTILAILVFQLTAEAILNRWFG